MTFMKVTPESSVPSVGAGLARRDASGAQRLCQRAGSARHVRLASNRASLTSWTIAGFRQDASRPAFLVFPYLCSPGCYGYAIFHGRGGKSLPASPLGACQVCAALAFL